MSTYHQNMRYGQHPPNPQTGYGYAPPQQAMDPHTFRQFYATQLAQLTFNSRPIIQDLSMVAQEYSRMAHVVAQCLETHIRLVPPAIKLPSLYLLDAIAKNVPNPYSSVLQGHVSRIFTDAYEAVDDQTKGKMEEMLWTWRTGSPTGRELFGVVAQRTLENFVTAKHSSAKAVSYEKDSALRPSTHLITKGQVLTEIDVILAQREQLAGGSRDSTMMNQLATLKQLHNVVRTTHITQDELAAILNQLRSLSKVSPAVPPALASLSSVPHTIPVPGVPPVIPQSSYGPVSADLRAFLHHLAPATQATPAPTRTITPTLSSGVDLNHLLGTLVKAGVVSATRPSVNGESGIKIEGAAVSEPAELAMNAYGGAIFGLRIKPTPSELARTPPALLPFLYERQTYQCKQCAIRFPPGSIGKKKLDDHLDMYFMQNSRTGPVSGRGHSRSWFVGLENWIHETKGNVPDEKTNTLTSAVEKENKLKSSFVVVPPGDEAKPISCPVCKESLKPEFLEEDEEWVWKNAIDVSGKIFHATCYADAFTVSNALLARVKQTSNQSRSATPEILARRDDLIPTSDSPTVTLKRKAPDSEDPAVSISREATPPFKRVAIAGAS